MRTVWLTYLKTIFSAKTPPPPPPTQPRTPPPSYSASPSVFRFGRPAFALIWHKHNHAKLHTVFMTLSSSSAGFGNRFGKPKGPRSYPETWVWSSRPSINIKNWSCSSIDYYQDSLLKDLGLQEVSRVSLEDTVEDQIQWTWKRLKAISLELAQHSSTLRREQEVYCYRPRRTTRTATQTSDLTVQAKTQPLE